MYSVPNSKENSTNYNKRLTNKSTENCWRWNKNKVQLLTIEKLNDFKL